MSALNADQGNHTDRDFDRDILAALPDLARFALALTRDAADADDLVQQSVLLAYKGYHTFRAGDNPRRWLFTICRNAFYRLASRRAPFVELDGDQDATLEALTAMRELEIAEREGFNSNLEHLDLGPAIACAMDSLSPPFREAVVLVDAEGLRYDEAAAVAGVPVGTIRSRLFRARRLLQQQLVAYALDAGLTKSSAEIAT